MSLCGRFTAALKLFVLAESLGGVESMVNHSATMSHGGMGRDERAAIGELATPVISAAVAFQSRMKSHPSAMVCEGTDVLQECLIRH